MKIKKYFHSIAQITPQFIVLLSVLTSNVFVPSMAIAEEISDLQSTNTHLEEEIPIDDSEDILEDGISTSIYEEENTETEVEPEVIEESFEEVIEEGEMVEEVEEIPVEELKKPEVEKPIQKVWINNGSTSTTSQPIVLDRRYISPQNENVTVTFTKLPDNPGYLTIEEVTLTDKEVVATNAISRIAYDITTDMEDGTFEYDLTLPEYKENVKVLYSENRNALLDTIQEVDNEIVNEDGNIKIEDLDHFTTYIVSTYASDFSTDKKQYTQGETVYAKATGLNTSAYYKMQVEPPQGGSTYFTVCFSGGDSLTGSFQLDSDAEVSENWKVRLIEFNNEGCTGSRDDVSYQNFEVLSNTEEETDRVRICHRTKSHSNPYIVNNPSKSGDVNGHDDHGPDNLVWYEGIGKHEEWGDIIPPFDYGEGQRYEGKNWSPEGQTIYNNNCEAGIDGNTLIVHKLYEEGDNFVSGDYDDDFEWSLDDSVYNVFGETLDRPDDDFTIYEKMPQDFELRGWFYGNSGDCINDYSTGDTINIEVESSDDDLEITLCNQLIQEPAPYCGNGIIEDGEECDYGEEYNGNSACSLNCTWESFNPTCEVGGPVPDEEPYPQLDRVNIGDTESESTHDIDGWSSANIPGNYGGKDDGTYRQIIGEDECTEDGREASFVLNTGDGFFANKLIIRHLDGMSNLDSFEIYINDNFWGTYLDSQISSENWYTFEIPLNNLTGEIEVTLKAIDEIWPNCSTYGQVAISWASIEGYECQMPTCVEEGPVYADKVQSALQGTLYNGSPITDLNRKDPMAALGAPDGNFYSLGMGGEIILDFYYYIPNIPGDDLSVHEITWSRGSDIEETAEVWVKNDHTDWIYLGEASSFSDGDGDSVRDGINYFDLSDIKLSWVNSVKLVESSVGQAGHDDGFDLDAVDGSYRVCEEPQPICGDGVNNQESEDCDGTDGVTDDMNFCTPTCKLIPIYDGDHLCDPGTTPVKIGDTYIIDSEDSDGIEIYLEKDQEYLFKVSGVYQFGWNSNRKADAAYGTENNWSSINTKYGIWGDTGRGVLSVLANLGRGVGVVEWDDDMTYNDSHIYQKAYTPTENITAQFLISDWYDEWYINNSCNNQGCMGDNSGSLELEVYECVDDSKITGYKWNDKNGDKEFNDNESGLEGWNIKAVKPLTLDEVVVDSSQINGTNTQSLPIGDYLIVVEGTWKDTSKDQWIDAEYLTETDWTSHLDGIGVLGEDQKDLQINGQFIDWGPYTSNHDFYYNYEQLTDSSLNFAVYDGDTSGKVSNWYNDNSGFLNIKIYEVLDSTWTDRNGYYELTVPGHMEPLVFEIPQMDWVREYPIKPYHIITFDGPGDTQSDINFGNKHVPLETSVSGYKWSDSDMNQSWDEGEEEIEGWEIYAALKVDEFDVLAKDTPSVDSILFESGKNYIIKTAGTYDANDGITADAKYSVRFPNTSWTDDVQNYESYGDTLLDLQVDGNSTICDWGEYNENHTYFCQMFGDNSNHTFEIYDLGNGSNNSGSLNVEIFEIIETTSTDLNGFYNMNFMTDAFEQVYVIEQTKDGYMQTTPMPEGYYQVEAGSITDTLNFGNYQLTYGIHGYKWDDINGNGEWDCEKFSDVVSVAKSQNGVELEEEKQILERCEPTIPAWEIFIDENVNNSYDEGERKVETDSKGYFEFDKLLPDIYQVCEVQDPSYIMTYPTDSTCHTVTVNAGDEIKDKNFGNYKLATIIIEKGVKGPDHIDEGYYSDDEFEVSLSGVEGTQLISDSETDAKKAVFTGLTPGEYMISETPVDGYIFEGCSPKLPEENGIAYASTNGIEIYDEEPSIRPIILSSGQEVTYICYNDTVRPELGISKINDTGGAELLAGDTVRYTITVTAPTTPKENGEYVLENVKVEDIFPSGFEYILGTWTAESSLRGDLKALGITTEPQYSSPGTWNLGDMKEGEIITLTYETEISEEQDPGTYKDIAYTYGDTLLTGLQFYGVSTTNPETNYVGTEVTIIEEPEIGEGEVLGAATSVELPATGASTYLTLGAIVSMIIGFILTLINPKKKISTYILITTLAFGVFSLLKPTPAYAQVTEQIKVEIEQPETPTQKQSFKIGYVALPIPINRDLEIQCYEETYGISGPVFSTKDGDCIVDETVITQSGTYTFYVTAQEVGKPSTKVESEKVTVVVDLETPNAVENYEKDEGTCSYILSFKTADDGRTSKVQIFRSDTQPFTANATTLIDEITVGPNQDVTYTDDSLPSCDKEYYYAIRAVDDLNNTSPFTTDDIVTVVEVETPVQQIAVDTTPEQGEVAGETTDEDGTGAGEEETDENGEVAGEETEDGEQVDGEDTEDREEGEGDEEEKTFWQRYWYVILASGVILAVALGYTYVRRRE
jgi:uncharacterized repeat protein (TIGR01451 family)